MKEKVRIELQRDDFDTGAEIDRIKSLSGNTGGLALFIGVARGDSGGRGVINLEFEAYDEMARLGLTDMASEAMEKFGLLGLTIIHRLGVIPVGGNIVLIIAAAAHRKEAFNASRWCIDELKKRIPIWKKEVFKDGQEWVRETP